MRRWYVGSAAILSLALLATLGPRLLSGGGPKEPEAAPPTVTKIAKSKIDKVTVYPSNALVTREVEVPDGAGLIELTISPMPDRIVPSTMGSGGCAWGRAAGRSLLRAGVNRFCVTTVLPLGCNGGVADASGRAAPLALRSARRAYRSLPRFQSPARRVAISTANAARIMLTTHNCRRCINAFLSR